MKLYAHFAGLASAVLLAPLGVGCASESDPAPPTALCSPTYQMLADGLPPGLDSLTLFDQGSPLHEAGTPCKTAADYTACRTEFDNVSQVTIAAARSHFFLATKAGGVVVPILSEDELLALTTPITSAHVAVLGPLLGQYSVYCPGAVGRKSGDGFVVLLDRVEPSADCRWVMRDTLRVASDGQVTTLSTVLIANRSVCVGRRFEELAAVAASAEDTLGEFLAKLAYLEAASVDAFARLEAELAHHGAPAHLLKRVRRARRDEVRHAATMTRLAASHGGVVPPVEMPVRPVPALEEIARENRVEGCLRETYGAAVGAFQAARAEDRAIGGAMVSIARDEAAHAELSWAIDAWAVATLDAAAHKRLDAAYDAALLELRREIAVEPGKTVATRAGIPTAAQASALLEGVLTVLATAA